MYICSILFERIKEVEHEFGEEAVFIHPGPWFHVFGLMIMSVVALSVTAKLVFMPKYNLNDFLSAIEKYKVNIAYVVPPIMVTLVIKHMNYYD